MTVVEIGRGKRGRRAYALDDVGDRPVAAAPATRRGLDRLADRRLPVRAAARRRADGQRRLARPPRSRSASSAGSAVLDLEGLWTRYDDPEPLLAEVAELDDDGRDRRLQEIYAEPIRDELIGQRIKEMRDGRGHRRGPAVAAAHRAASTRRSSTPASTCSSSAAPRSRPSTCPGRPSR